MTGNTKQRGFSLIEVLVATAVISVIMVAATALLLSVFRSQREARELLYMQSHARYVLSLITDRSRSALLDYDFYTDGDPSVQNEFLALITSDGLQVVFRFDTVDDRQLLYICEKASQETGCDPNVVDDWSAVTPNDLAVPHAEFILTPSGSPYFTNDGSDPFNTAPLVTMSVQLQMEKSGRTSQTYQTAVTPRYYVR